MFGRKLNTQDQDIWISSDLHFFHKSVLDFCPDTRPWKDLDEMHEALIEEWNSKIKEDDIIFHLGDFSFKGKDATESILSSLKGKKVFIMGNHCKVFRNQLHRGKHNILEIMDYCEVRVDGIKVCMSHFPMVCWNQAGRGSVMLHGHVHGSYQGEGRIVDVGYDKWGSIIPIREAIDFCLSRDIYSPDHHTAV